MVYVVRIGCMAMFAAFPSTIMKAAVIYDLFPAHSACMLSRSGGQSDRYFVPYLVWTGLTVVFHTPAANAVGR